MSLASLLLQFDRDYPGNLDQDVEIPGQLWAEWMALARAEAKIVKPYQLGIIACSKSKVQTADADGLTLARNLYTGQLFKASLVAAEKLCDRVLILSAKHGVVEPDELLATYDQKLPTTGSALTEWARSVDRSLPVMPATKVLCLAPEPYWSPLSSSGWEKPLKGLGIGRQKAELKKLAAA